MDRGDDLIYCGVIGKSYERVKVRCLKRFVIVVYLERFFLAKGNVEMLFVK